MCVRVDGKEGVAWIILDRPEKLNALNAAMLRDLGESFDRLEADPGIRVVILRGAGDKAFAAGGDIAEFRGQDSAVALRRAQTGQSLMERIETFPKPVVAAVNGWVLGGGCELALACHIRIASEKARFGLPEVSLGLIPGYGGTQRLSRLVGQGVALDLLLTGEPVSASRALEMGLVSRVFPAGELDKGAADMAATMLTRSPQALSAALLAVRQGLELPLTEGLELEASLFAKVAITEDARQGIAAFLEKRAPKFGGR